MAIPQETQGKPMGYPLESYGVPMGVPWATNGPLLETHGRLNGDPWTSAVFTHELFMGCSWATRGRHMRDLWTKPIGLPWMIHGP